MKKSLLCTIAFAALCVLSTVQQAQAQTAYSYCEVGYDSQARYVYGYAATYLDYYAASYYDPEVYAFLTYENTEIALDEDYGYGYGTYPAEVFLYSGFYRPVTTYYTVSTHFVRSVIPYNYYYDYWYDPYGFSFAPGGSIYGGYYPWYSNFYDPYYYLYGRRRVVARLYVGITTPPDSPPPPCGAPSSSYNGSATANAPCPAPTPGVNLSYQTETRNNGIPLANPSAPPPGSLPYRNSTVVTATGTPTGGTYSWSTSSNKVTLSNVASDSTSSRVTINAMSRSDTVGDVIIDLTYTAPNSAPFTLHIPMTVQQPTSMRYVNTYLNQRIAPYRDQRTQRYFAGWEKRITWQVHDHLNQVMTFQVPVVDTLRNDIPNSCLTPRAGEGTPLSNGAGTDRDGRWGHRYAVFSSACLRGGNCGVNGYQEYTVNGFVLSNDRKTYTYTCNSISVLGDGSTPPSSSPPPRRRTYEFVDYFWTGALDTIANDADYQYWTNALNSAQAQGPDQMLAQARALGRRLFQSAEYANLNRSDEDFVSDLYLAYLERQPDPDGYNSWLNTLRSYNAQGLNGREHLLQGFEYSTEFMNLVNSLEAMPPVGDACDPVQEQDCYNNGGSWDTSTCTCSYPPPDPCLSGGIYICE